MTLHPAPPHRPDDGWTLARVACVGVLAIGLAVVVVAHPPGSVLASSPGPVPVEGGPARIAATPGAFGRSGAVRLQLRMPSELFDFPIELRGPAPASYHWVRASDSVAVVPPRPLAGTTVAAPARAGFYRLALAMPDGSLAVDSLIVGVLVPFEAKLGGTLNGYRIGRYQWERSPAATSRPPQGFVEVLARDAELPLSAHFRVADFLTHDAQTTWPRYLALDPRVVDKVELVLRYLGALDRNVPVNMNSGFRTPLHNQRVPRAATDSRHQYGDAADLAIDADGDGRLTMLDGLAVSHAVEMIERQFPDLVGGLGVYGNRGGATYVHIDVRGERKRWRG